MSAAAYEKLITASARDRLDLFLATANRIGAPVGNVEKDLVPLWTTKTLPSRPRNLRETDDEEDLYSIFGGTGEAVYLGDGIWLTGDGGAHDWGR